MSLILPRHSYQVNKTSPSLLAASITVPQKPIRPRNKRMSEAIGYGGPMGGCLQWALFMRAPPGPI